MSEKLDFLKIKDAFSKAASELRGNREWFNDLDSEIGDSDHGDSIDFTFRKVQEAVENYPSDKHDIGDFLKSIGRFITLSGGAAMGPLYGSSFTAAGKTVDGRDEISLEEFVAMWEAFVEGLIKRGNVKPGEKTMLDTVQPAVDALREQFDQGAPLHDCCRAATEAAKKGMESTREMLSTRGRSSRLGERSKGHIDPGSASMNVFLTSFFGDLV